MRQGSSAAGRAGGVHRGPLYRFLGVAEPAEPFPNLNDRETIKKIIRDIIKGPYLMLAGCVAAAVWWWLG